MARYGEGSIDQRGAGHWRLRYRLGSKSYTVTVAGTKTQAVKALRARLKAVDDGQHVAPDRITVSAWVTHWTAGLQVGARTAERYEQLLQTHVVPVLGSRPLQALQATEIDALYKGLTGISDRTRHHVHVVLGTCLRSAVRKGLLVGNPVERADPPRVENTEVGKALSRDQLATLVKGFCDHPLHGVVAVAVGTGARRNEILALRWSDFDTVAKTLSIARAIEETKAYGRRTKSPKTARGARTIAIDDGLAALLLVERDKHLSLAAGIPDGATVNLTLVRLPEGALIFPAPAIPFDFTKLRDAHAITRTFTRKARALGFAGLRFHDLRHSHGSLLLAGGVSIPVVAARLGHSPDVLLRTYAHAIKTQEERKTLGAIIGVLSV